MSRITGGIVASLLLVALLLSIGAGAGWAQFANQPIVALEVAGNSHVPSDNILAISGLKIGDLATDQALGQAAKNIANMGFFVPRSVIPGLLPVEGGVKVIFNVVEYPVVSAIKFIGNAHVSAADLESQMETKVGQVLNEAALRQDQDNIQVYYQSKGYIALITGAPVDPETGVITIELVEVSVREIKIEGNRRTKSNVVLRELATKPGQVLNTKSVQEDLRTLRNLDLFEEVSARYDPVLTADGQVDPDQIGFVDFVVIVKEKRTGNLGLGLGYSPRDGVVGFVSVSEQNLWGRGQQAKVYVEQGGRQSYDLYFKEPWFDKHKTSLSVSVYDRVSDRDLYYTDVSDAQESYEEQRRGFTLGATRPVGKNRSLGLTYKLEEVERSGDIIDEVYLFEPLGKTSTISMSYLEDSRDFYAWPTSGSRLRLAWDQGMSFLGGEFSYGKLTTEYARYFCLKRKATEAQSTVLATRVMYGTATGDVPVFESFIVGGADTLRGYKEERFWGEQMLLATAEYRFPMGNELQGVAFMDVGDAWGGDWTDPYAVPDDSFNLHVGYGVGIRVNTPIGPIRIDYGLGEDGARTHFSIGHAF